MIIDLSALLFFIGDWGDIVYFIAGGVGIISTGIVIWFLGFFLWRMRQGGRTNSQQ